MTNTKTALLLVNLGTPKHHQKSAVRQYLKQFLSDPRVIDLPWLVRKAVLHLIILPFRPAQSAKAYAAIWDTKGSPLLFNSQALVDQVQAMLGPEYEVALGMRYGQPSIQQTLSKMLKNPPQKMIILPLFPQYSSAATGSALEEVLNIVKSQWQIPALTIFQEFYQEENFVTAQSALIQAYWQATAPDFTLFSYHSLPVRHIKKTASECAVTCFNEQPCPRITQNNQWCYRAQCFETTRLLAEKLGLATADYCSSFQSKLGRTPWIGPDIQKLLPQLIARGVKNLLVVCPSFVADCLETLEEIGIRARAQWQALGGGKFTLVPSLNADPRWVRAVAEMVRNAK